MSTFFLDGIGEIELCRSPRRRTVAVEIRPDGRIRVHAPSYYPKALILDFLMRRRDWILTHQMKIRQKNSLQKKQGDARYQEMIERFGTGKNAVEKMRKRTRQLLVDKVPLFAEKLGVSYGKISVRAMTSRWGSCSAKGDLSFNLLLSQLPEEVIDYVVIHELCHRIQMNHSAAFWQLVAGLDPAYPEHRRYLKNSGNQLIELLGRLKENR